MNYICDFLTSSMKNIFELLTSPSTVGAIIGTALPLFFMWIIDINKEKRIKKYFKDVCSESQRIIINDIEQLHIDLGFNPDSTNTYGNIKNLYFKIQNVKTLFDQCDDIKLKFWFNTLYIRLPSLNTPRGNYVTHTGGTNADQFIKHFKTDVYPNRGSL